MQRGLYDKGFVVYYKEGDNSVHRNQIQLDENIVYRTDVIKEGETLYEIARRNYGTSYLWFIIADVNDNIDDIFDLPVGETIKIPAKNSF